ncbi:MAG: DUF4339 domain-containing protein [Chthoniobacteraceae bacterium]
MDIYIVKGGAQTGPFPMAEVQRLVNAGEASINDLGWHAALTDWVPLSNILPGKNPLIPAVPRPLSTRNAEETRKTYLNHEASVKSIGLLYYIAAIVMTLAVLGFGFVAVSAFKGHAAPNHSNMNQPLPFQIGVTVAIALFAWLYFWLGAGMRSLNPKAKGPAVVLAVIGLLGFPLGTLINAYILYLLLSEKGKMVFSPEYKAVIEATPHIKYKTSIVVWIFVILLLGLIALGVFAALTGAGKH